MLKIMRQPTGYAAQLVSFVSIYSATGARDPQREAVLGKAMSTGALMKVKSVRRDRHGLEDSCAVHGDDVCLSVAGLATAAQ